MSYLARSSTVILRRQSQSVIIAHQEESELKHLRANILKALLSDTGVICPKDIALSFVSCDVHGSSSALFRPAIVKYPRRLDPV